MRTVMKKIINSTDEGISNSDIGQGIDYSHSDYQRRPKIEIERRTKAVSHRYITYSASNVQRGGTTGSAAAAGTFQSN